MKKIWAINEKTVYSGTSIPDFNAARTILEHKNIPYKYKTLDLNHNSYLGSVGVTRSMGANTAKASASLLYEILVRKDDYDAALNAISSLPKNTSRDTTREQ